MFNLSVSGTREQIGLQHGEQLRLEIGALCELRTELAVTHANGDMHLVRETAEIFLKSIRNQLPLVTTELLSIARAANVEQWRLIVAGAYSDIVSQCCLKVQTRPEQPEHECTLFIYYDQDSSEYCVGGTWDSHVGADKFLLLLEREVTGGCKTLALTTVGWPAQQGINSLGLAFATANIIPNQGEYGVPYIASMACIAETDKVSTAIETLQGLRHASSHAYMLIDASGQSACAETSCLGVGVVTTYDSVLAHTNHFLFIEFLKLNRNTSYEENSINRLERVRKSLNVNTNEQEVMKLLMSKEEPGRIRRTDFSIDGAITHAMFLLKPCSHEMKYLEGSGNTQTWHTARLG